MSVTDLALIDVVGADLLEDLALDEVPNAALCHHWDGHGSLDRLRWEQTLSLDRPRQRRNGSGDRQLP